MKLLFLSDTHWNLSTIKDEINFSNIDFLVSHFPARWIMDWNSFSHRWLNIIKDYIEARNPRYFIHWHLHYSWEEKLEKTEIIQVYKYLVLDF